MSIMITSLQMNMPTFPDSAIKYLKYIIEGKVEPFAGFWLEFEKKVLFKKDDDGNLVLNIAAVGTQER
jgi:hypothetical protein